MSILKRQHFKADILAADTVEVCHDTASHFVNTESAAFVLDHIPKKFKNLKKVLWIPFCPHHGKSDLDRFFGHVTRWLTAGESDCRIETMEIMLQALKEGVKMDHKKFMVGLMCIWLFSSLQIKSRRKEQTDA